MESNAALLQKVYALFQEGKHVPPGFGSGDSRHALKFEAKKSPPEKLSPVPHS